VGVGRLGFDQDYYSSQEKDTKEKEISTSNILNATVYRRDSSASQSKCS
jgi:hypothetical protein